VTWPAGWTRQVAETGTPVVQINTGGGCHLDAPQVRWALERLPLDQIDLLLIENVGNLVCPTGFALGEQVKVVVASVPEGHDKPIKYPGIFAVADGLVLNKVDLAPYIDFDAEAFRTAVRALNAAAPLFECRARPEKDRRLGSMAGNDQDLTGFLNLTL